MVPFHELLLQLESDPLFSYGTDGQRLVFTDKNGVESWKVANITCTERLREMPEEATPPLRPGFGENWTGERGGRNIEILSNSLCFKTCFPEPWLILFKILWKKNQCFSDLQRGFDDFQRGIGLRNSAQGTECV